MRSRATVNATAASGKKTVAALNGMELIMMDRLSEIRARCETASKGPWKIGKESPSGAQNVGTLNGILTAQTTSKENAVFIAHAREDIPYLLAQLELSKAREHPVNLFPELTPQQRAENAEIVALTARAEKAEAERDTYKAALQNWHEQEGE